MSAPGIVSWAIRWGPSSAASLYRPIRSSGVDATATFAPRRAWPAGARSHSRACNGFSRHGNVAASPNSRTSSGDETSWVLGTARSCPAAREYCSSLVARSPWTEAAEWQNSIDWLTRLVQVDTANATPYNIPARTDIGTANFNLGRYGEAKRWWTDALQIKPDDVQLHYNMGFLYANAEPIDLPAAKREWERVVELAPTSDLAQTVRVHLTSLTDATPEAGATAQP